jgi:hypothetical protein
MSYILFDKDKKFICPCGCKQKMNLSIQHSEDYGWNAFVGTIGKSGHKIIASTGEDDDGS